MERALLCCSSVTDALPRLKAHLTMHSYHIAGGQILHQPQKVATLSLNVTTPTMPTINDLPSEILSMVLRETHRTHSKPPTGFGPEWQKLIEAHRRNQDLFNNLLVCRTWKSLVLSTHFGSIRYRMTRDGFFYAWNDAPTPTQVPYPRAMYCPNGLKQLDIMKVRWEQLQALYK